MGEEKSRDIAGITVRLKNVKSVLCIMVIDLGRENKKDERTREDFGRD